MTLTQYGQSSYEIRFEKESVLNQIQLQSDHSLNVKLIYFKGRVIPALWSKNKIVFLAVFLFWFRLTVFFHPTQSPPSSRPCDCCTETLCQNQQRCMKASIVSSWRLAEAQEQLCSLGVHSSESLEQERARMRACPTELTHTEEEWRDRKSVV